VAKRKQKPPRPSAPQASFPPWLPHALLVTLAIAIYVNSVTNGFVGDDKYQLLRNPLLTDPAKIPRIFTSGAWSFTGIVGNYYRPLQFLVYMLLYEIAGFHAPAFHLFMILLNAGNTLLLYLLVQRMSAGRIAFAAAALFAVHPVHTEVVDWAAALPDLMVTTFVLLGLLIFARQGAAPRGLQIVGHCAFYLLALMSKETGVMLMPLYLGFGFFCLGQRWSEFRQNAVLYVSLAAALGIYLAMRIAALGGLAPAQQTGPFHLSPLEFVLSAVVTAAQYVWALLFPVSLNYFHIFHPTHAVTVEFVFSALILAAIVAAAMFLRMPLISYGIFWFAAAIAPALNLTGVGQNVFTERYLYLPSAGFCWIAAWAWDWLASRQLLLARAAGVIILFACALEVMARNLDWQDSFTMWQVTLRQSPTSGLIHDALAAEYFERNQLDKCLEQERLAVQYEPGRAVFHMKLGYLVLRQDPTSSIVEFQKVLALEPATPRAHCDLALAYEVAGNPRQAADEYRKALQLQPQYADAKQGYERVQAKLR